MTVGDAVNRVSMQITGACTCSAIPMASPATTFRCSGSDGAVHRKLATRYHEPCQMPRIGDMELDDWEPTSSGREPRTQRRVDDQDLRHVAMGFDREDLPSISVATGFATGDLAEEAISLSEQTLDMAERESAE